MIDTGDVRKGSTLDIDGKLVKVIDFSLKDLRTGSNTQMTVMAGTKFQSVRLERQHVQFLYQDANQFHFMDTETFDQILLDETTVGENARFFKEQDVIDLLTYDGEPIDIELPTSVVLTITQTDPGFKGDTATGGNKPATLETGLVVAVPLFLSEGDQVKVDTRSGEYIERVG
jgi:elongation factor P